MDALGEGLSEFYNRFVDKSVKSESKSMEVNSFPLFTRFPSLFETPSSNKLVLFLYIRIQERFQLILTIRNSIAELVAIISVVTIGPRNFWLKSLLT